MRKWLAPVGAALAINYTIGVPECYGTNEEPQVVETPESVTVTLTRVPPPQETDAVACIDIALLESVDVTLEKPLGDRRVLDGSFDHAAVLPAAEAGGSAAPGPEPRAGDAW